MQVGAILFNRAGHLATGIRTLKSGICRCSAVFLPLALSHDQSSQGQVDILTMKGNALIGTQASVGQHETGFAAIAAIPIAGRPALKSVIDIF